MSDPFSRRVLLAGGALLPLALTGRAQDATSAPPPLHPSFPQQDPRRVSEVVGAAHRDLERVRTLVEESPALANADWDWGFGDWETPLGAAAHVGQREIAEYLLSRGARASIFSAAMLGQLAVVRAFVEANPGVERTAGPHGIPLIAHARAGGPPAAEVLRYLESLPKQPAPPPASPPTPEQRRAYLGRFGYEGGVFEVGEQGESVTIKSGEGFPRFLVPLGEHTFHPAGVPGVKVVLSMAAGVAVALTVLDGRLRVMARRLPATA
jgi:hypothetical protein